LRWAAAIRCSQILTPAASRLLSLVIGSISRVSKAARFLIEVQQ
jgi:hypothetical protein